MTHNPDHTVKDAERGLPDGLGSENTQGGSPTIHHAEPDSLVYGLGSADTQSDVGDPEHTVVDHSEDGAESGLPLGLGSANTQSGPAVAHPDEPDSLEFGLGSADSQTQNQAQ